MPTELLQSGSVHELAWSPVRLAGIESKRTLKTNDTSDRVSKILNLDVVARTDVEDIASTLIVSQKDNGVREIFNVQELAPRCASAPNIDRVGARLLRFMEFADQCWQRMG